MHWPSDAVEIHCHGGSVCVQRVLALLLKQDSSTLSKQSQARDHSNAIGVSNHMSTEHEAGGDLRHVEQAAAGLSDFDSTVRLAQPGEFTLRAFLNGRLDLSQAEAVQALVSAKTEAAADSALSAMRGGGVLENKHSTVNVLFLLRLSV